MCGCMVGPTLKGKTGEAAATLDHVRPWRLRPDLAKTESNIQLICKQCHDSTCKQIEREHWPDAELIAEAKKKGKPLPVIGLDGWRI